jgi:HD superfamily phosphohydrolase YqeK
VTFASPADLLPGLPSWAVVAPRRARHIAGVVGLVEAWAVTLAVGPTEAARWRRAALLHDALRDAPEAVLAGFAPLPEGWPPSLWHGPAAAAAAAREGEGDPGVLAAVHYHSVGHRSWDDAGRMLLLADWLEPGRTHDREVLTALAARVIAEPAAVLREVAARKLRWLLHVGRPIPRETWDFWNSLVAAGSSSSR